jgi:hypothetical protein
MKALKIFFFLLISFSLLSYNMPKKVKNKIIGTWAYSGSKNAIYEYSKEKDLSFNKRGYEFKRNGKLIVRQNIGWCGTPPISYGNDKGTWKKIGKSKIRMQYNYWGGEIIEKWEIKDIDKESMSFKILDSQSIRREYGK